MTHCQLSLDRIPIESFISTSKQLEMLPRTEYYATYREPNRQIPVTAEERDHVAKFITNSVFSLGVSCIAGGLLAFGFGRFCESNKAIKRVMIRNQLPLPKLQLYVQIFLPWTLFYVNYTYMLPRHGWEHFKNEQNYPGFIWRNLLAGDENFFGFQVTDDMQNQYFEKYPEELKWRMALLMKTDDQEITFMNDIQGKNAPLSKFLRESSSLSFFVLDSGNACVTESLNMLDQDCQEKL